MWSTIQFVSVLGSLLVLVAYMATQFGYLSMRSLAYAYANVVGSGILAVIAALEAQWGFLLLEGAWALVSLVAVVKQRAKAKSHRKRRVSDPKVVALARGIRWMREQRPNLTYQGQSYSANELKFELLKGLN